MEWYEERHWRVCVQMHDWSEGEARALETLWIVTAVTYPEVEVGYDYDGLCYRVTSYPEQVRLNMGDY